MAFPDVVSNVSNMLALQGVILQQNMLETRMFNDVDGKIQYIGWALTSGASTSAAVWYVLAFSYDVNGFLDYIQLPDNGPGYLYIWDSVADYF